MPHYLYFSLVFVILTQNKIDHRIQDKCRMSFPANVPIITEYNGLTAKNESLFGKVFYCIKFET